LDFGDRAKEAYEKHVQMCLELVPKEKLLVLELEKEVGWGDICGFLGVPEPKKEVYPAAKNSAEYGVKTREMKWKGFWEPLVRASAVGAVVVGGGLWYGRRR
jgi:hypothetical protein